ncbi:protein kinase WD40 [Neohortaea acidophila]|uniref:non-specific serine/threonine protein kinase n=1 Tax=Neohortaea acidophila TaxID=245834 RepID=A0A6A6PSQ0_9PEZI|nr:protein kinase WD40 [Neohortaea acidophila]KAF2483129.1 protein kinase WD40 [Neohortaea acidophila]
MGQGYSLTTLPAGPSAIETTELADLTFEKPLGGGRFLRTVRARHQHGVVVVKVCAKNNPTVSFKHYAKELRAERYALSDVPNVLPYQKIRETATIGVLVRQFIHSSLYDRVSIRPFLENIEKKWIAFQLLCAVRDCHSRGRYHGDIKTENVLVTSWGWVYLTDFASVFKPVYLPEGNPAEFTFYYDVSARRTCYLAPERFLASGQQSSFEGGVEWSMDIFSLGCVIAELFTEVPTFTLSQLFAYRKGEYDPTATLLNKVDDEHVRSLISSMIRLSPEERWHAQDYLDEFKGKAFPLYFYQHLHTLMQEITDPSSGCRPPAVGDANNAESDNRINRIYDDFEMLSVSLGYESSALSSATTRLPGAGHGLFPLQVDLPNNRHTASSELVTKGDNGTFILLNVVTTSLRSVARASSKVRACELLLAFAERIPDEAKLDRVLPYVMPLLEDSDKMVLVAALRTMTQLLALVNVTSPVNSFLFTQYIFPRLQIFVRTPNFKQNPIVRATYAACLASLAESASRFLDMMQALRAEGSFPSAGRAADDDIDGRGINHDTYDATRIEVLDQLEGQTKVFLTDNDTAVRRAFLSSVSSLCVFFGESRASDLILSHLNTYLNDPDWQLKCAFFRTIVGVAVYIGGASLEEFILPLMLQALSDPQEFVVEQALRSLASMAEMGLLQRAKTWELIDTVARFVLHPNMWIKEAATHFISSATTYLSLADTRILVAPLIKPYLKIPASTLTEAELLDALKKPLPRAVLDLALQWAGRVDKSVFWKQARDSKQLAYRSSNQMPPVSSVADLGPKSLAKIPKTDEDEQWLGRLRNAGMRSEDEMKILAFREYLWRTAQLGKNEDPSAGEMIYEDIVSLVKLDIPLQTIVFETSVDVYRQRKQDQEEAARGIEDALQEAATSGAADTAHGGGLSPGLNGVDVPTSNGTAPKLPELRRQTSGSGQSLSSSPSSGIALLGKGKDRASSSRSNAARLLSGADLRNKTLPEVATDDSTAAGKLNPPSMTVRRKSPSPSAHGTHRARSKGANNRAGHNYAGNDPSVLRLLDAVYVDTFPMDVAEFGPIVQPLPKGPILSNSSQLVNGPWRPTGQLVAVLGEHSSSVTRIVVSPDHAFFVTGSDDSFIRVWDSSRLERNVTHRSRYSQSVGQGVKVTSICFIEATHCFVCTGSDGSVHFFKVSVADSENGPQYASKMHLLRTWQIPHHSASTEYAVWSEHFRADSGSMLLLATNAGRVLAVDLRSMSVQFEFHNPAQHGTPICFCLSRRHDWILIGTSHGVLDLWDLRFQLRLRSWAFPRAAPITRLQLHPGKKTAKRNWICVTGGTGRGEVTVWDIEKVICHYLLRPDHIHSKTRLNTRDYELKNLDDERSESLLDRVAGSVAADPNTQDAALALTTSSAFGVYQLSEESETQHLFVITGGPDDMVRFWDFDRADGCRLVSGGVGDEKPASNTTQQPGTNNLIESNKVAPASSTSTATKRSGKSGGAGSNTPTRSAQISRYEAIRLSAQHLLEGHLDRITDVAVLERPFGMVLSADRSGQVFVFQ